MTRPAYLSFLLLLMLHAGMQAQNYINIGSGLTDTRIGAWNKSIEAYNFARPWLDKELPTMGLSSNYHAGFTAILARALFISPDVSYHRTVAQAINEDFKTSLRVHRFSGGINFDIFPMEFGLDTVSFIIRPFVRLGGGGSAFLPRVKFNDAITTVNDEAYKPIVWTYQFNFGLGCRFSLSSWFDVMPVIQLGYFPNVELKNFAQALHGTAVPELENKAGILRPEASIYLCFRMRKQKSDM